MTQATLRPGPPSERTCMRRSTISGVTGRLTSSTPRLRGIAAMRSNWRRPPACKSTAFTYLTSVEALIHCGPTLEACATEIDAALAFAARASNEHATAQLLVYRQLVRSLRGETHGPGRFSDGSFDEMAHRGALAANPATGVVFHAHLALAAAIFGDAAMLSEHAAIA